MNLFYLPDVTQEFITLSKEESRHLIQVLRRKTGDPLDFTDGKGHFYKALITDANKKACQIQILETREVAAPQPQLHIGIAPTKNIERFEWFLEKTTEIGIQEITPLRCEHSERKNIRTDRLEKILIAAMKQSLSAWRPILHPLTDFDTFIQGQGNREKYIAHCQEEILLPLQHNYQGGKDVSLLIGPEGDFSLTEILSANQHGFRSISLGKKRLRTETAGIVACHIINLANEQ